MSIFAASIGLPGYCAGDLSHLPFHEEQSIPLQFYAVRYGLARTCFHIHEIQGLSLHIHILGICGTFMGGIATIARAAGHKVTGCDAGVYPPMSSQLISQGIELIEGFSPEQIRLNPDLFVIGNIVTRGNPLMEEILNRSLPYVSGPQWLSENVLRDKWVLAVAGTHGKTTTSAMLAWILEYAGLGPGFLIGGIPENFGLSARLGSSPSLSTFAQER